MTSSREIAVAEKSKYKFKEPKTLTWEMSLERALNSVLHARPVVLAGPPGTGKTLMIERIIEVLKRENRLGKSAVVQFHRKFSYEDFIEGYSPAANGGFEKKDGVFKSFCRNPSVKGIDLFVIDEMNRAELSTTFGEVLYAIEDRERRAVITAHFKEDLRIPTNLSIIGTINTADRNIAIMDFALRRRFDFVYVFPDADQLRKWVNSIGFAFTEFTVDDYVAMFLVLNRRIRYHPLMGFHMQLGHSMFVPRIHSKPITGIELSLNLEQVILPQLEAYCGFGNQSELAIITSPDVANKFLNQQVLTLEDLNHL